MSNETPSNPILRELPDELGGPRVIVRPYRPGDGPAVFEAIDESRTHVHPWLPWPVKHQCPADTEAAVRRWRANWLLREDLTVGLWEREGDQRYLGGSGLHRIQWDIPSFEIGYWLRRSAEGHGYMTEAVRLLCGLAFDILGGQRVIIRCAVGNTRSGAVARRLGFILEGTMHRDRRDADGVLHDTEIYAMTPDGWAARTDKGAGG